MKVIRHFAAALLILSGILHTIPLFGDMYETHSMPMLVFGIFYLAIGILLFSKRDFSPAWGIIFPMIGLSAGFFAVDVQNWNILLGFLFALDAIVVVCCAFLFFNKARN
jgi:hypothetical protein